MIPSSELYQLTKWIWTDRDFEQMGWHDVIVQAITSNNEGDEFVLDIDYIFAWVEPEPNFAFWISPATLVFKDVWNLRLRWENDVGVKAEGLFQIEEILRSNRSAWTLRLFQGEVSLDAAGFVQYTRQAPRKVSRQHLSLQERGGISFDRPPGAQ